MANIITRRVRLSRRLFLKGLTAAQAPVMLGLPPLVSMFNSNGTAYAAETVRSKAAPVEKRFVIWFNGNGIPERYWIPGETGADYDMTPCSDSAGALARQRSHPQRARQFGHRQYGVRRPSDGDERADDMHALFRKGSQRPFHRPGAGRQDGLRDAVPLTADRCFAGIVRRSHAEEHELGRAGPGAAAGGDSASPFRPCFRRQG